MTNFELLGIFCIMGFATFLTRFLPFALQKWTTNLAVFKQFSQQLPSMIMVVLVCFSLTELSYKSDLNLILTATAVAGTIFVHIMLRNPLLSIILGTAIYIIGLRSALAA